MLSLNDLISKFRSLYSKNVQVIGDKLAALTDSYDVLGDILNDGNSNAVHRDSTIQSVDAAGVIQTIADIFHGYTSTSGEIDPNSVDLINFTTRGTDSYIEVIANGVTSLTATATDASTIQLDWRGLENKQGDHLSWEGWFNDLVSKYSSSQVIRKACELCQRGELTAVNLRSFFGNLVTQNSSEAKDTLEIICDSVSGSSVASQSAGLIAALREVFSGVVGCIGDDNTGEIHFSNTDFHVNTSVCFDFNTIISLATSVVSIIGSIVNPIIGAAVYGIGTAIKGVVNAISENDGTDWKYLEDGHYDFEGYATPMFQIEVASANIPAGFKSRIEEGNGFAKFQNGFCVLFGWQVSSNLYRFEGFMSTRADLSRYETGADGLFNFVLNLVSTYGNHCKYAHSIANNSGFKTNLQYWLNSNVMAGAERSWKDELNIYGNNTLFSVTANRFLMVTALWCYLYAVLNRTSLQDYEDNNVTVTDWLQNNRAGRTNAQIVTSYLWAYNDTIGPNVTNPYYFSSIKTYVAGVVNNVIPCLRDLLNDKAIDVLILLNSLGFHDDIDDSLDGQGIGTAWATSYDLVAQGNPQIFPPTSTVSIWVKMAVTAVASAVIIATAAVVSVNIKRKIQFKAYKKRMEITNQLNQWAEQDHVLTYDEFTDINRQARKYNRFWGKIAGNTLDVGNNWLNYNTDTEVSIATSASKIANVGGMIATPSIDKELFKLISGSYPPDNS